MNWHGVDKLLPFAERYPELTLNIIGYLGEDFETPPPPNVRLHGYLSREEVQRVLAGTDVVFGTLALHRKCMEEASPLKVREALAFGIPVIIAYHDTDLDAFSFETVLRIPNTEGNVRGHAERIHQFAWDMIGRRVDFDRLASTLDQRGKEKARLAFFNEIIAEQRD
jgi:glycosyltransferase involved in cell wall biosynthesis